MSGGVLPRAVPLVPAWVAKVVRRALGVTQAQVAQAAGIHVGTYKRFERGCETGRTTCLAITFVLLDAILHTPRLAERLRGLP